MLVDAMTMLSIWSALDTLAPLVAFAIINGVTNGSFFTSMPTAVGTLYGSAGELVAMGMVITGWTGDYFAGAPIVGYILQVYGGKNPGQWAYRPAIFYAGSIALGAAGFVRVIRLWLSLKAFKKL
jgi:MFS family permease